MNTGYIRLYKRLPLRPCSGGVRMCGQFMTPESVTPFWQSQIADLRRKFAKNCNIELNPYFIWKQFWLIFL